MNCCVYFYFQYDGILLSSKKKKWWCFFCKFFVLKCAQLNAGSNITTIALLLFWLSLKYHPLSCNHVSNLDPSVAHLLALPRSREEREQEDEIPWERGWHDSQYIKSSWHFPRNFYQRFLESPWMRKCNDNFAIYSYGHGCKLPKTFSAIKSRFRLFEVPRQEQSKRDVPFFIRTPFRMAGIRTLNFLSAPLKNEIRRVYFLSAPLKRIFDRSIFCRLLWRKNPNLPFPKSAIFRWGSNTKWNV